MIDLLGRDVMDRRTRWDRDDVGRIAGRVAAYVAGGWVLNALLAVGVLGLACRGPVFLFGFAVDYQAGESVCLCEYEKDGVHMGLDGLQCA